MTGKKDAILVQGDGMLDCVGKFKGRTVLYCTVLYSYGIVLYIDSYMKDDRCYAIVIYRSAVSYGCDALLQDILHTRNLRISRESRITVHSINYDRRRGYRNTVPEYCTVL